MNRSSKPRKTASFHHELTRLTTLWHLDRVLLEEKRRIKFLCPEVPRPPRFKTVSCRRSFGVDVTFSILLMAGVIPCACHLGLRLIP